MKVNCQNEKCGYVINIPDNKIPKRPVRIACPKCKTPNIIKPPASKKFKPGIRRGLVELVDIPATIADICNLELEHDHFGRSLSSFFINENLLHRDAVFCEGGRLRGEDQAKELASKEDQIPVALYWPRLSVQKEDYISHGKAVMVRNNYYKYVYCMRSIPPLLH